MNVTMNTTSECLNSTPQQPVDQTTSPWCAIPVGSSNNLSSLLQSCCRSPVASYAYVSDVPNCWEYCNVTVSSTFTTLDVLDCLTKSPGMMGRSVACSLPTMKSSSTPTYGTASQSAWLMIGIVMVSAIMV